MSHETGTSAFAAAAWSALTSSAGARKLMMVSMKISAVSLV
jgi:hypothetical protein